MLISRRPRRASTEYHLERPGNRPKKAGLPQPRPEGTTVLSVSKDSFPEFLARLQARDDAAAHEVFQRFARQLLAVARRRFAAPYKHKVDPEDVVQSAYKSFFRCHGEGKIEVGGWDNLWAVLVVITLRKCADRVAYYRAECRDLAREEAAPPAAEARASLAEPRGWEPTPLEAAMLSETLAELLASLDEDERPVIELSLQGYTTQEISEQLGQPERTVRRLRERIRKRLERGSRETP